MIIGFENILKGVSKEDCTAIRWIVATIQDRNNKPISNQQLRTSIGYHYQIHIGDVKMRELIHHIRVHNLIPNLLSNGKGYFIAEKPEQVYKYIESLRQRQRSINEIIQALEKQATNLSNQVKRTDLERTGRLFD